jgi:Domain of unknown function (DUF4177)
MSPVRCPSCGEKGNLSDQLIGKKLRCHKCGASFVAGGTPAPSPVPLAVGAPAAPAGDTIEVDGLDASTWASTAVAVETHAPEPEHHHEPAPAITHSPQGLEPSDGAGRQYKVLTQKDRWFEGKFELAKLEEALNHYARQGWVVRAMATPHVTGFSGGPREEIVILMER